MKNYRIFAASSAKTILRFFVCVAIFIATYTVLYAADIRLSISNGCCDTKPVIVFAETERDSLSSFIHFNFSFMAKTMENQSKVNNSSLNLTSTHETGTFLTDKNIKSLKHLFNTQQNYVRHVGCLWVLRDLVDDTIDRASCNSTEHYLFPLLETINELIGSVLQYDLHFDNHGRAYKFQDGKKVFI